ncbi:MAG TPA: bifunctional phosphoglucose/phosphomannose isomerase [Patescibacteria group bacterium]|nr:bifunctional phosphoglucose/phosphomannose isomerase [Patescibacteria group bacterium]
MGKQTPILDDIEKINEIDLAHYHAFIADIPSQCEIAHKEMSAVAVPSDYAKAQQIIICGMGGSAIGADLVRTNLSADMRVPVSVHRDYELPAYVGPDSLVVLSSYSGETEEVLSSFYDALARKAKIFIVAGGGTLVELAKANNIPFYQFSYKSQPRATIGFVFVALTVLMEKLGVFQKPTDIAKTVETLKSVIAALAPNVPTEQNKAKLLAYKAFDQLLVVAGSGILTEVARRWKCQFNENAKAFAFFELLPELNHNMVEGIHFPKFVHDEALFILLENSFDHPQNKKRFTILKELFDEYEVKYETVQVAGSTPIEQKLSAVIFGDYVSFYLAILNNIDPTPVDTIQWAKKKLK